MSAPATRSNVQSTIPRAWSAPLPTEKKKELCDRCLFDIIEEVIKLNFNAKKLNFCSSTCLKMWIFQVIK